MFSIISTMFWESVSDTDYVTGVSYKRQKRQFLLQYSSFYYISNSLIVNNLGKFGCRDHSCVSGVLGLLAAICLYYFQKEERKSHRYRIFLCRLYHGSFNKFQFDTHTVSMYILYALMLQVGISIGSNKT